MSTIYAIRDRQGEVRAYHVRDDGPDGKRMSWRGPDKSHGLNGTASADLPLYNVHRLDEWADPIVVTEGEKAAHALVQAGYHAVGTVTGAASTPSDAVLADLEGRGVVLWPDADDTGREHMRRIGESLHERAAVGWLEPPVDAAKGWDAADAIAEGMSVADLLRDVTAYEPAPPRVRIMPAADFLAAAAKLSDDDELVEDFIQEEGLYLHVGEPGSFKTMLALQLAASVGHGLPFLGMSTKRTNVVYFGFEGTTRTLAQRIRQQMTGLGLDDSGFHIAFREPVMLDDTQALDDWCEAVEPYAPCLLVLDPFAEAHTSDEVKDASPLLGGLRRLQRTARGPLWVTHHPNQDTKASRISRVRGHGAYVGAADAVYWQDRPDRLGTRVEVSAAKVRDLEASDAAWLEFDPETCLFRPTTDYHSTRRLAVQMVERRGEVPRADVIRFVSARTAKTKRAVERAIGRAVRDQELVLDGETLRMPAVWEKS